MDLSNAMSITAAGMKAQSARLRVVVENLANAESTATAPGATRSAARR
jgi:flagellar basal-body rod protein FlgC